MKHYMCFFPVFLFRIRILRRLPLLVCSIVCGAVILPFFLWSPQDFIYDCLTYPVRMDPFPDSLNLYTFLYRTFGWKKEGLAAMVPFLACFSILVYGTRARLKDAVTGFILAFFFFFFFMKQASLNYYYFLMQALLLSLGLFLYEDEK